MCEYDLQQCGSKNIQWQTCDLEEYYPCRPEAIELTSAMRPAETAEYHFISSFSHITVADGDGFVKFFFY